MAAGAARKVAKGTYRETYTIVCIDSFSSCACYNTVDSSDGMEDDMLSCAPQGRECPALTQICLSSRHANQRDLEGASPDPAMMAPCLPAFLARRW